MGRGRTYCSDRTRAVQHENQFSIADAATGRLQMKHLGIAWALFRFYLRLIPTGWYRAWPFLPVPPRQYLRWRLRTAYGNHRPPLRDVLRDVWQYGEWLRTFGGN